VSEGLRSRLRERPLAAWFQLLALPLALPGLALLSGPMAWAGFAVAAVVLILLGVGALRRRTVPWLVLGTVLGMNAVLDVVALLGLQDIYAPWMHLVGLVAATGVLQALLARTQRPRPAVWAELVRHRWLALAGAAVFGLLSAGQPGAAAGGSVEGVLSAVTVVAFYGWAYLVWRAVRRSKLRINAAESGAAAR
jgi:hypothetical protein